MVQRQHTEPRVYHSPYPCFEVPLVPLWDFIFNKGEREDDSHRAAYLEEDTNEQLRYLTFPRARERLIMNSPLSLISKLLRARKKMSPPCSIASPTWVEERRHRCCLLGKYNPISCPRICSRRSGYCLQPSKLIISPGGIVSVTLDMARQLTKYHKGISNHRLQRRSGYNKPNPTRDSKDGMSIERPFGRSLRAE